MNQTPPLQLATMTVTATAEYLSTALGGEAKYWLTWLANDRKPGRVNRLLPPMLGPGRPRYRTDAVDTYITDFRTKNNRLSPAVALQQERKFGAHISAVTKEEGVEEPFVLLVSVKPMSTYKLTPQEARRIASRLISAADAIDSSAEEELNGSLPDA